MTLKEIAHSRSGDKGNTSTLSVIVYDQKDYALIAKELTAEKVKQWFSTIVKSKVERYELPQLGALNFVLREALSGGVTQSLKLDKHGKTLSSFLLEMPINKH